MQESIIIPARFRGPPESGNGGYVAGVVAEQFLKATRRPADTAIEVTLRAPTPLDQGNDGAAAGEAAACRSFSAKR